eukprot:COSAG03_NODE_23260_length_281_cov_1.142857_1_plen_36_part_10
MDDLGPEESYCTAVLMFAHPTFVLCARMCQLSSRTC